MPKPNSRIPTFWATCTFRMHEENANAIANANANTDNSIDNVNDKDDSLAVTVKDGSTDGENWKAISAVTYRLTRKRIADANIEKIEIIEGYLRSFVAKTKVQAVSSTLATVYQNIDSEFEQFNSNTNMSNGSIASVSANESAKTLWDDIKHVDEIYSSNEAATTEKSPYVSNAHSTSFRGTKNTTQASNNNDNKIVYTYEEKLQIYISSITRDNLPLE